MKLLIIIFLTLPILLYAQPNQVDIDDLNINAFQIKGSAPDSAWQLTSLAKKMAKKINYPKGEAISLNIQGLIKRDEGNLPLAEKLFIESLNIQKSLNDTIKIASVCNNLADLKSKQEQYTAAFSYANQAIDLLKKLNTQTVEAKRVLGRSYINKGNIFFLKQEYAQAAQLYDTATAPLVEASDNPGLLLCLENLAGSYAYSKQYKNAEENYKKVLKFHEENNAFLDLARICNSLGSTYLLEGKLSKAREYFQKSIAYSKKIQSFLLSNDANKNLYLLEQLYSLRQRVIFSILLFLLFLSVLFVIWRARQKKKEFENHTKNQDRLNGKRIIEVAYSIRKEIAQNVHDNIATPLTHIKRFLEPVYKELNYNTELKENIVRAIGIADRTHVVARDTSYRLRPESIDWADRIKLSLLALEKKEAMTIDYKFDEKGLENSFSSEKGEKISGIVCNLLSNVDKHAHANIVRLEMKKNGDFLYIFLEDNGVGFDFKKANGIGLESIRSNIKLLNGTLEPESTIGKGTKITINIPL